MSSQEYCGSILVSIVAPVYNIADYLPSFISSVIRQTYSKWELLLVDDGSADSSGQICDCFSQCDSRIRVFHRQNGGVSSARNVGLKEMKGDWVLMPDPDDELTDEALEILVSSTSTEIDLISSSYIWFKNGERKDWIEGVVISFLDPPSSKKKASFSLKIFIIEKTFYTIISSWIIAKGW